MTTSWRERESPWQGRSVETGSLDAEILRDCWVSCLLLLINHERGKKQKAAEHYCFSFFFFFFSFLLLAFWVSCGGIGSEHDDRPARAAVPNSWTGNILGRQPCRASYVHNMHSPRVVQWYYSVLCCIMLYCLYYWWRGVMYSVRMLHDRDRMR